MKSCPSKRARKWLLLTLFVLGTVIQMGAQSGPQYGLEAGQPVSLSANKIIQLLQQETGLLLQVKKLLVRKFSSRGVCWRLQT